MVENISYIIQNPFFILFSVLIGLSAVLSFIESLGVDPKATEREKDPE